MRDVCFRLVIIVIRDKIFDRVFREVTLELPVELRGKGLVGGDDQGGPLHLGDDMGHGEGFSGTRNAEEGLFADAFLGGLAVSFSIA